MLCYRCGSHVPDGANKCQVCGQPLAGNSRQSAVRAESGRGPGPLKEGQLFADRYLIKNLLKISSIGWLFRARDQDMDADVVLRVIAPNLLQTADDRTTFLTAAKSARRVRHPNIIRIFDSGFEEGVSYYSMPYTQGLSLKKIISLRRENNELFSMAELFGLFAQIASAIDTLGDYGPICSLKPSNIIVLPDLLKIIGIPDYLGLPHLPYVAMQRKQGNLSYMAPSAQKEGQKVDPNADIYSLAVILGEMLTGHRASENPDAFSLSISAFPQHVRQAFNNIFDTNGEPFPYICAYDFVTAIFPEEAAREAAEAEVPSYDEQTLKTVEAPISNVPEAANSPSAVLNEATVQDAAAILAATNEHTTADIPAQIVAPVDSDVTELEIKEDLEIPLAADETVQDFASELPPPAPVAAEVETPVPVPVEEELVVNAAEMEEEEPPPPPVAPVVVSAQNLVNKVPVEEPAGVDGDSMPSFAGIPPHLRVDPISATSNDTLIVERPVKTKKGHGGVIAVTGLLLLALGGGAYWYVNNNGQLPFGADSSGDKQAAAVKDLAPVKDIKTDNKKETPAIAENDAAVRSEQKNGSRGKNDEKTDSAKRDFKTEVRNDSRASNQAAAKNEEKIEAKVIKEEPKAVIPAAKEEPVKVVAVKEESQKETAKSTAEAEKPAPKKEVKEEPKANFKAESTEDVKKTDDTKKSAAKTADTFGAAAAIAAGASQNEEKAGSCPADMIFIPAGNFQMGTAASDSMRDFEDKDLATKYVKGFCIDIYEYPNQAGAKPVQSLSFGQAQKHCQQKGKRLCREEEWEKACKGANNYRFPYGNRYSGTQCNVASGSVVPSGQFARCKSSYGVFDMAGNLAEWTSSKLEVDLPDRVYKGGAFGSNTIDTRCSARKAGDPNSHEPKMGVRCCKNPL